MAEPGQQKHKNPEGGIKNIIVGDIVVNSEDANR